MTAINIAFSKIDNNYSPSFNHMDLHWQNILVDKTEDGIRINAILDFGNSMFGLPYTDDYRLHCFLFFTEDFYNSETQEKYLINLDELFICEILYGLEFLVFEGMMKSDWGGKINVLSKCELYLN